MKVSKYLAAISSILLIALCGTNAHACNSMANDRWGLVTLLGVPIFLPMLLLIPAELAILRNVGGLEFEYKKAYVYCLPAKIIPIALMSVFYRVFGSTDGVLAFIAGEIAYSVMHLMISFMMLISFFRHEIKNEVLTATLISTVIPWAYTAGIPLTAMLYLALAS